MNYIKNINYVNKNCLKNIDDYFCFKNKKNFVIE